MDETAYSRAVQKTIIGGYHEELVGDSELDTFLTQLITISARADVIEKALFRGVPMPSRRIRTETSIRQRAELVDLIRGVIGVASEVGELAEHLRFALSGEGEVDKPRILSEIGDVLWYLEFLYIFIGKRPSEAREYNIRKLWKRNGIEGLPAGMTHERSRGEGGKFLKAPDSVEAIKSMITSPPSVEPVPVRSAVAEMYQSASPAEPVPLPRKVPVLPINKTPVPPKTGGDVWFWTSMLCLVGAAITAYVVFMRFM